LFVSSIILGIAALVAISSFGENLQTDINKEAKKLLGADLVVESNHPLPDSIDQKIKYLEEERSDMARFASMVYLPKTDDTRMVQINALEGDYPFYGNFSTEPANAQTSFRTGGQKALVEKTLMIQFGLERGDSIKVGQVTFEIEGQLNTAPGRSGFASSILPVVYIPKQYLDDTKLIQFGSRVDYNYYYKIKPEIPVETLDDTLQAILRPASIGFDTVKERKEDLGRAFSSLTDFLNLVGFIALILGCIGVASAVHIYIKSKLTTVAILRCLGASGRQAFIIYLLQISIMGFIGAVLGAILGSFLQKILPIVLGEFLPLENISTAVSTNAILLGIGAGVSIAVLFALIPLLGIRKISPLKTLRASYEPDAGAKDPYRWVVIGFIILFIGGFTWLQTGRIVTAAGFIAVIAISFSLLAGLAKLVMWSVRKFFPTKWSYVWRQSIANLYRPNNQTLILLVSIGLGTALISTLFFTQDLLLNQVEFTGRDNAPNMIMYDIQTHQKEEVVKLTEKYELPLIQNVPIVTMRLENIDGITKAMNLKDTTETRKSNWSFSREYRVTYRDSLTESEELLEGEWHTDKAQSDTIWVSVAENIIDNLKAEIGSKLVFNVQGAQLETYIGSIRKIDFGKLQTNFFVVFPEGILEKAPQFHVLVTRTPDEIVSGNFQRELVKGFANVSVIDLTQILKTVDTILDKVSFVIKFMALFSILTGLLVLISSIVLSKFQRIKESVLLRTLGASQNQIIRINGYEYFMLGTLSTMTGILLSFGISWLLAKFEFEIPFSPNLLPPLLVFLSITALTVLIGMFNSREVITKPPLEVLRKEI
jgi:putative ABC transport system permease protein